MGGSIVQVRLMRRRIAALVLAALMAAAAAFAASATFGASDAQAALDMFLDLKPVPGEDDEE